MRRIKFYRDFLPFRRINHRSRLYSISSQNNFFFVKVVKTQKMPKMFCSIIVAFEPEISYFCSRRKKLFIISNILIIVFGKTLAILCYSIFSKTPEVLNVYCSEKQTMIEGIEGISRKASGKYKYALLKAAICKRWV